MAVLAVLFAVLLTFPFGEAEATAVSTVGGLTVEVSVEVLEPASAVLVRGMGPVDELPPVSLVDRGDGTWGGLVEMPIVEDILIGFEHVPISGGPSTLSQLRRLSELGVDEAVFEIGRTPQPIIVAEPESSSLDWLWLVLGIGGAVLALVLVFLWAWPRRSSDGDDEGAANGDAEDEVEDEAAPEAGDGDAPSG